LKNIKKVIDLHSNLKLYQEAISGKIINNRYYVAHAKIINALKTIVLATKME
jgi:hypothetical protein